MMNEFNVLSTKMWGKVKVITKNEDDDNQITVTNDMCGDTIYPLALCGVWLSEKELRKLHKHLTRAIARAEAVYAEDEEER